MAGVQTHTSVDFVINVVAVPLAALASSAALHDARNHAPILFANALDKTPKLFILLLSPRRRYCFARIAVAYGSPRPPRLALVITLNHCHVVNVGPRFRGPLFLCI
jgi:hypothetical protein